MRSLFYFALSLLTITLYAQDTQQVPPDTEVFLFDLSNENGKMSLANVKNISNNEGYDNQPHFLDDSYIIFSSNRNGQTDIAKYYMTYGSKTWLNFSPGSEYSPIKIPGEDAVSAINLETDGTQKLYKYSLSSGEGSVLIDDIIIGYQLWYDNNTLISSVLENDMLNLYKTDLNTMTSTKLADNVGRSLHKIPNSDKISYVSKSVEDKTEIRSMDISSGKSRSILKTLEESEDLVWLKNGSILMGQGSKLYINNGNKWKEWVDLKQNGIDNITRLAINEAENKLAVVGTANGAIITSNETKVSKTGNENSNTNNNIDSNNNAAQIVQSHIDPFNQGDLEGFLEPFAEDVVILQFPNKISSQGKDQMRQGYDEFFKTNDNLSVKVNKRIALGNYVIDEELATLENETHRQVTIYNVQDGKIRTMTFIKNQDFEEEAERLVNQQLNAYNERDIEGFMTPYASDVKLYNYPAELRTEGADAVKSNYKEFFERTPDLRGVVKNRMIIGNKVIDQEHVTINGQLLNAVAIYEIENGKIAKVTFIQ